jgi:uncharacterized protein
VSWDAHSLALAGLGIFLMGLSKAGFGGGLGILTAPLCVVAFNRMGFDARFALGVILPLLCAADLVSLWYYRRKWIATNLRYLLPGVVVGTVLGVGMLTRFSPRQLNIGIGVLCVGFVLFQLAKEKIFAAEGAFAPNHLVGVPCGVGAGITSTFANGAGPLVAMFLIPQRLPKELYVGTTVLIFTWINWIKLGLFVPLGIVSARTLPASLVLVPFVPLGVWVGFRLNRLMPEALFMKLVYFFTFLTGLHLILG